MLIFFGFKIAWTSPPCFVSRFWSFSATDLAVLYVLLFTLLNVLISSDFVTFLSVTHRILTLLLIYGIGNYLFSVVFQRLGFLFCGNSKSFSFLAHFIFLVSHLSLELLLVKLSVSHLFCLVSHIEVSHPF